MNTPTEIFLHKHLPWLKRRVEIETFVFAVIACVVGAILSILWFPLGLIGILGAIIIFIHGSYEVRTPPQIRGAIVVPCDGVIIEVSAEIPPPQLGIGDTPRRRVRIVSSPFTINSVYAPFGGRINELHSESGDRSRIFVNDPDVPGLTETWINISNPKNSVALCLRSSGVLPSLVPEITLKDRVKLGQIIGKRPVGGWCDVYLPENHMLQVQKGATVIGGETSLAIIKTSVRRKRTVAT